MCKNERMRFVAKNQIEATKKCIEAMKAAKNIFRRFDGKIVNKRICTAFDAVSPLHQTFHGPGAMFWMSFSSWDMRLQITSHEREYGRQYMTFYKNANIYNNRLDAAALCAEADGWIETLEADIAKWEKWEKDYDDVMAGYMEVIAKLQELKEYRDMYNYGLNLPREVVDLMKVCV